MGRSDTQVGWRADLGDWDDEWNDDSDEVIIDVTEGSNFDEESNFQDVDDDEQLDVMEHMGWMVVAVDRAGCEKWTNGRGTPTI